jgi:hypothetical protein
MNEHSIESYQTNPHNRDQVLQSQTPEHILKIAEELFHIDLNNTDKVLKKIGSLSLSEKMSDQEMGMKLARVHEAFIKAKDRVANPKKEELPIEFEKAA